jgi:YVTN family beta-propeller protein
VVYNDRDRKVYLSCHDSETVEVVDCAADSVIARFSTGGSPWVSTFDRTDDLIYAGTSWGAPVICGAGDTLVGEITEDFYVKGACWNPHTGLVYMARNYDADILTIDGASHTVIARVGVPESPAEMATMTSSPRAYACHTSARAVTESVSVVCADSLVAAFRVRPSPVNLFCDSERGKVYVANWESSCLTVINDGPASVTEAGSTTGNAHPAASVVRGVLRLPYSPFSTPHSLFSLDGCKALALHPGPNDVSRLAPGVYFVTVNDGPNSVNATKVIIQH